VRPKYATDHTNVNNESVIIHTAIASVEQIKPWRGSSVCQCDNSCINVLQLVHLKFDELLLKISSTDHCNYHNVSPTRFQAPVYGIFSLEQKVGLQFLVSRGRDRVEGIKLIYTPISGRITVLPELRILQLMIAVTQSYASRDLSDNL
jgi:hypothetical protein